MSVVCPLNVHLRCCIRDFVDFREFGESRGSGGAGGRGHFFGVGPKGGRPKISRIFPSPAPFSLISSLSGSLLVEGTSH